jgi:hypothetical protein
MVNSEIEAETAMEQGRELRRRFPHDEEISALVEAVADWLRAED